MPSKTDKQARFMRAAAHDPKIAAKHDIPQSTAREFVKADKKAAGGDSKGKTGNPTKKR